MKSKILDVWQRLRSYLVVATGVSTVEYALIVVAVIGIVGVGIGVLGGSFNDLFADLASELETTTSKAKVAG